jgi:hypothetical protein
MMNRRDIQKSLKVKVGTTEERFKSEYDLFVDRNFGAQSWPTLAGYLTHQWRGERESEVSRKLAGHLKIFTWEIYQREFEILNVGQPKRRTTRIYSEIKMQEDRKKSRKLRINVNKR